MNDRVTSNSMRAYLDERIAELEEECAYWEKLQRDTMAENRLLLAKARTVDMCLSQRDWAVALLRNAVQSRNLLAYECHEWYEGRKSLLTEVESEK